MTSSNPNSTLKCSLKITFYIRIKHSSFLSESRFNTDAKCGDKIMIGQMPFSCLTAATGFPHQGIQFFSVTLFLSLKCTTKCQLMPCFPQLLQVEYIVSYIVCVHYDQPSLVLKYRSKQDGRLTCASIHALHLTQSFHYTILEVQNSSLCAT